jgi:hypothetical protein
MRECWRGGEKRKISRIQIPIVSESSNGTLLANADESTTSFIVQTRALLRWQMTGRSPLFAN